MSGPIGRAATERQCRKSESPAVSLRRGSDLRGVTTA